MVNHTALQANRERLARTISIENGSSVDTAYDNYLNIDNQVI
jgi:hypothetical protein